MVLCMPLKVELLRFTFRLPRKLRKFGAATQCSEKQAQEKLLKARQTSQALEHLESS